MEKCLMPANASARGMRFESPPLHQEVHTSRHDFVGQQDSTTWPWTATWSGRSGTLTTSSASKNWTSRRFQTSAVARASSPFELTAAGSLNEIHALTGADRPTTAPAVGRYSLSQSPHPSPSQQAFGPGSGDYQIGERRGIIHH